MQRSRSSSHGLVSPDFTVLKLDAALLSKAARCNGKGRAASWVLGPGTSRDSLRKAVSAALLSSV